MQLQSSPASQYYVSSNNASHVPAGLHLASRMVAATVGLWKVLASLETRTAGRDLDRLSIAKPVFVSGVARAGSTILTEIISRHAQTTSHRYSDFPLTFTPYWWNSLRERLPLPQQAPQERAHRDRLMITADSPEAIEEVLWMHFFPEAHRPEHHHLLGSQDSHPKFEKHYRDHIRKLLAVRHRQRYVAKNNYLVTRLPYLLKLFPDARIVIPIRNPLQQVASLIKQHRLFSAQDAEDPRVSRQLQMAGHFEFGPRRCPIVIDDARQAGYRDDTEDLAWYAQQWADVYGFLHQQMQENESLRNACLVLRYEDLCHDATHSLQKVFAHLNLDDAAEVIETAAPTISEPAYYRPDFSAADEALIHKITAATAALFDYR